MADEVASGIDPCVQVGAAAKRLTEIASSALGHMVNDEDGDVVTAVEFAKKAEQAGDICGTVLIQAMQTYERVEHEQLGPERGDRGVERASVALDVEAQTRCGDDVQVEAAQRDASVLTDLSDAVAYTWQSVFGEIDERRARAQHLEATETGGGRSHRDREVEP